MRRRLLLALLLAGAWHGWQEREQHQPPGVLAPAEPLQDEAPTGTRFSKAGDDLQALAHFDIEARVLGKEIYRLDREARLAPVDLALGWGPMSDSAVLEKLSISQGQRFYFWRATDLPLPPEEISSHSANMHLIPADAAVEHRLKSLRKGQVVHFRGYLVEARSPDGWRWRSSLSRTDTGAGACELVWVEDVEVR